MEALYKLFLPQKLEAALFVIFGLIFLLAQNIEKILMLIGGDPLSYINSKTGMEGNIQDFATGLQSSVNPRVADFLVWLLIGCLVFILASTVIAIIKSTDEELNFLHYFRSPSGRHHELIVYLTKLAIRLSAFLGFILWLALFFINVNPWLSHLFFTSISTLKDISSWFWLLVSFALASAFLYFFAILARLAFLKIRFFAEEEESKS